MFLKISENTCVRVSGLQLYLKRLQHRCFPVNIARYLVCSIHVKYLKIQETLQKMAFISQILMQKEKEKFTEYLSILKRPKDLLCFDIFASYGCSKNITSPFSDSSPSCFKRLILIY